MKAEQVRTDVHSPLLWKRPPRGEALTDTIRRVVRQNPIFCDYELEAKGAEYAECLPRMVSHGILKRQGTHVYSSNIIDQTNSDVKTLLFTTASRATTAAKLERHSKKLVVIESKAAAQKALAPSAENLSRMRRRIFDFDEAGDYLHGDPSDAIIRLIASNRITVIHPRLYRKMGVSDHGTEMHAWIDERAERDVAIQTSIDASYRACDNGPKAHEPLRITSVIKDFPSKKSDKRRGRIKINFNRLGSIYGIAGGPGNKYIIWNSWTEQTRLTKEAADAVAREIFPRFMRWGDLIEIVDLHLKDKSVVENMPAIRAAGRLDEAPRTGEKTMRTRFDQLREVDRETPLLPGRCVLYVDHREDQNIVDALTGISNLAIVQVKLETCDFKARWGEGADQELHIERKTKEDFVKSMIDGRLQKQTERMAAMKADGKAVYLMTQGYVFDADPVEVGITGRGPKMPSGRKIMAATVDLAMLGIPTIAGNTWQQTAEAIIRLISRSMAPASLSAGDVHPTSGECANQDHIAAERSDVRS